MRSCNCCVMFFTTSKDFSMLFLVFQLSSLRYASRSLVQLSFAKFVPLSLSLKMSVNLFYQQRCPNLQRTSEQNDFSRAKFSSTFPANLTLTCRIRRVCLISIIKYFKVEGNKLNPKLSGRVKLFYLTGGNRL